MVRAATKETVLAEAIDLARAAAESEALSPHDVGEHLGVTIDDERLVSHRFAAAMPGYPSWSWVVTLARVPRGRSATVCEVHLLPEDGALLAPKWLPWAERLKPGDLGPGDRLPFKADDPRLEPGFTPTGRRDIDAVALDELALARARVLARDGRREAAQRWYRGSHGPTTAGAVRSPASCGSCGFLVRIGGELGQVFGICANEWSPDDGKVVSFDHGCGAHSETDTEPTRSTWPAPDPLIDEFAVDLVAVEPVVLADINEPTEPDAPVEPDMDIADVVSAELKAATDVPDTTPKPMDGDLTPAAALAALAASLPTGPKVAQPAERQSEQGDSSTVVTDGVAEPQNSEDD